MKNIAHFILAVSLVFMSCPGSIDEPGQRLENEPTTADTCKCPFIVLYHDEEHLQTDSGKITVAFPTIALSLKPDRRNLVEGQIPLGKYDKNWHYTSKESLRVQTASVYETRNGEFNYLCGLWIGMCRRGFKDNDWADWKRLAIYKLTSQTEKENMQNANVGIRSSVNDKSTVSPGLKLLENSRRRLRFTFGYNERNRAALQVLFRYKESGIWLQWPRYDLVYQLPNDHIITLDFNKLGFTYDQDFDFSIRLLVDGHPPIAICPFAKS